MVDFSDSINPDSTSLDSENRNKFIFTCPSKTFLMGEYGALKNAPALLVSTAPRFKMEFRQNLMNEHSVMPMWDESDPLFKYYLENEDALLDFHQDYEDPFNGSGGFGGSSAQWIFFYNFVNQYQKPLKFLFDKTKNHSQVFDDLSSSSFEYFEKMILKYRSYSSDKYPPSGYDLVSQMVGGITYFDMANKDIKKMNWNFSDIGFVLVKNSEKLETHFHLKYLDKIDEKPISAVVQKGLKALQDGNSSFFVEAVNENYNVLRDQGFVAEAAKEKIKKIKSAPGVLAVKGCGALGTDVFLVVTDNKEYEKFKLWSLSQKLNLVANEKDIANGFEVDADFSYEKVDVLN